MCLIATFSIQLHNSLKHMYNVIHVSKLIEILYKLKGRRYHIESSDIMSITDSMVAMVTVLSLSQDPLA